MKYRKVLIIGFGSLGQGLLPLLFDQFSYLNHSDVTIIAKDAMGKEIADEYKVEFIVKEITKGNFTKVLHQFLDEGNLVINVSVDVGSVSLMELCMNFGTRYIDTCVEPWKGGYQSSDINNCTNAHLRFKATALRDYQNPQPTIMMAHGANPGLVSHFVIAAIEKMASARGFASDSHQNHARQLGIKTIHIAERDTQDGNFTREDTFYNTWSVDGFLSEGQQPAEFGLGNHDFSKHPLLSKYPVPVRKYGDPCFLRQRGFDTKVRSWVPSVGEQEAYLITHHEAISLNEHMATPFSYYPYKPTVFYAYHPSPATMRSIDNWKAGKIAHHKVMRDEITHGFDELGVLLTHAEGSMWYGSTLTIEEARKNAPYNSATSLQVNASIIGALKWMEAHPMAGVVEAEDIDYEQVLSVSLPYLGKVGGVETTWTPGPNQYLTDILIEGKK